MKIPERFTIAPLSLEQSEQVWGAIPEWRDRGISAISDEQGIAFLCAGVVLPGLIRDAMNLGHELASRIHGPKTDENVPRGTE